MAGAVRPFAHITREVQGWYHYSAEHEVRVGTGGTAQCSTA
jgi:hypothetical protein